MAMEPWHPMRELQSMRDMMDRFFQDAFSGFGSGQLSGQGFPVDVAENDNAYLVRASLPGIKPEDIDISVEGNMLTIRGETRTDQEQQGQGQRWIRREHRDVSFYRSMTLPSSINADQVQANYENGMLTLTLPKSESAKARHIQVQSGTQASTPRITSGQPADAVTQSSMESFPASDAPSMSSPTSTPSQTDEAHG
jgi:HSP20 family protein